MTRKKRVLIMCAVVLLCLYIAGTIWGIWFDKGEGEWEPYYPVTDEEYFGVGSLSELPAKDEGYGDVSGEIENSAEMIIGSALDGETLGGYAAEKVYDSIRGYYGNGAGKDLVESGEACIFSDYTVYDVKHDFSRAVADVGIDWEIRRAGSDEVISGAWCDENYPYKLYLVCEDGVWFAEDIFIGV